MGIKSQLQILSIEVIRERVYDPKEIKLIDLVFESLRDESPQIRKLSLQILSQILIKYH